MALRRFCMDHWSDRSSAKAPGCSFLSQAILQGSAQIFRPDETLRRDWQATDKMPVGPTGVDAGATTVASHLLKLAGCARLPFASLSPSVWQPRDCCH